MSHNNDINWAEWTPRVKSYLKYFGIGFAFVGVFGAAFGWMMFRALEMLLDSLNTGSELTEIIDAVVGLGWQPFFWGVFAIYAAFTVVNFPVPRTYGAIEREKRLERKMFEAADRVFRQSSNHR